MGWFSLIFFIFFYVKFMIVFSDPVISFDLLSTVCFYDHSAQMVQIYHGSPKLQILHSLTQSIRAAFPCPSTGKAHAYRVQAASQQNPYPSLL